jgi:hypothetical protein
LAPTGSASLQSGIAAVSRIPTSMELWFIGDDGSVQDYFWYEGNPWQNFELAPAYTASPRGIAAVSRIPTSMELWYVGMHINSYEVGGDISGSSWYQDPTVPEPPNVLSGNVNYFLDAGGSVMTGVTVAIRFTQDFVSTSNAFSFQLNCYSPQSTAITTLVQQFVIYASPGSTQLVARIDNWLNGSPSGELSGWTAPWPPCQPRPSRPDTSSSSNCRPIPAIT